MLRVIALGALALLAIVIGFAVGPVSMPLGRVIDGMVGRGDPADVAIIQQLRMPRALLAFVVGGSLAVTGATLQALVRNPLADPYLLGLSGGAGLGAVLAIATGAGGVWSVPLAAFVGALLAVLLVYRLAIVAGGVLDARVLLLSGVVVSAFSSALVAAVVAVSPATELRNAFLWLLGGFDAASWQALGVFIVYAAPPAGLLCSRHRALDLLALGEEPAQFLGVDVERLKRVLYLAASLLTAAAVAVSGIIGFVGLVIPHAIRMLWGHTHRTLLPAAFLLGGVLLVLADTLARSLFAPRQLPVGVVTAIIGVPLFTVLLRRWAR